jgi:hypothetical protein
MPAKPMEARRTVGVERHRRREWRHQMEPGSFRLKSVETGETLRFRKVKSLTNK